MLRKSIENNLHLVRQYARIFVRRHDLFRERLEENCELRGTDSVQGQISEYILVPNSGYSGPHFGLVTLICKFRALAHATESNF